MTKLLLRTGLFLAFCVAHTGNILIAQSDTHYIYSVPFVNTGARTPEPAATGALITPKTMPQRAATAQWNGRLYSIVQFINLPDEARLEQSGLHLLEYIGGRAYFVSADARVFTPDASARLLRQLGARAELNIDIRDKRHKSLVAQSEKTPNRNTTVAVQILLHKDVAAPAAIAFMQAQKAFGFTLISDKKAAGGIITANITNTTDNIEAVAALSFVQFIDHAPAAPQPLNYETRQVHATNTLSRAGGRNLLGMGETVGVGDIGDAVHNDYLTRIEHRSTNQLVFHSTHVTGILAGNGAMNPRMTGIAPEVKVVSDLYDFVIASAPEYLTEYGMRVTNNSYAISNNACAAFGFYDGTSNYVDNQLRNNPELLHVFAVGNSGNFTCAPFALGYGTVYAAYQSAKNTFSVGNLEPDGTRNASSSIGPVRDGRIKPDIVAVGGTSTSTSIFGGIDSYDASGGTSQAAPVVTAGAALLTQRYKQLNAGAQPKGVLLKAVMMNTADDYGNAGPDYQFGYGVLNLRRAVENIESGNFISATLPTTGTTNTHMITVPTGATQLRVLLHWLDREAPAFASPALVNDLDLSITTPSATTVLPWKLDPLNPANVATQGADHLNNTEQITIDNPAAGSYTANIFGFNLPFANQNYVLTYEILMPLVYVTYPTGEEKWVAGETETIRWDAFGSNSNTFTVEYSTDGGSSYTVINSSVAANIRKLDWIIPTLNTTQARVRVSRNSTALTDASDVDFAILGVPTITLTNPCAGYINFNWTAITGATAYDVMVFDGVNMATRATVASPTTTYLLGGLTANKTYYVTVRAVKSGVSGRRAIDQSITPSGGACTLAALDNDMQLDALTAPLNGRLNTPIALTAAQNITISIRNLDNTAFSGTLPVSYQINGGAIISETTGTLSIAAGGTQNYTFTTTANLAAANTYSIKTTVTRSGDTQTDNNTNTTTIKNVANAPVVLPFMEGFEGVSGNAIYTDNSFGLAQIDRIDYTKTNNGRARTRTLTSNANGGTNALSLDAPIYQTATSVNEAVMTINLSSYAAADLRLDFYYKHHGEKTHAGDKVWIRGSYANAWVVAYDLYANQATFNTYAFAQAINVTDLLTAAGQTPTSSFQIKFGQEGNNAIGTADYGDGYTFDDIKVYAVANDLTIRDVTAPNSCVAAGTNVSIDIYNTSTSAVTASVPVSCIITPPTGAPTTISGTANLAALAGKTIFNFNIGTYTFAQTGEYTFSVSLTFADDILGNNTVVFKRGINQGSVSAFPYLQGFEAGDGGWYHNGVNDDWTRGTPTKTLIDRAANGANCWATKLSGNYTDAQRSFLTSPCFNLTGLANPMLSFSHIFKIEYCPTPQPCDFLYMEYSTDGKTWSRMGAQGASGSTQWYNDAAQGWTSTLDATTWHVATLPIPTAAVSSSTRFRFIFNADAGANEEGVAIDDIHIYSKQAIYTAANTSVTQTVSGSSWINFASGGNLIVSINPQGQTLGSTEVREYIFSGALRNDNKQYYPDRNWVVRPTTAPAGNVRLRMYFTKAEIDEAIAGTGCATCTAPKDAYRLGITKYSGSNALENGTLADNAGSNHTFILPANTEIVPYDNGYYAEFEVSSFSEFWLNHGSPSGTIALPVTLTNFTVTKQHTDALLRWTTASELNNDRFEVEVARGDASASGNKFEQIGMVRGHGTTTLPQYYAFTDTEPAKEGSQYYRLKQIDADGKATYTPIQSLFFEGKTDWAVFPNPSQSGVFNIIWKTKTTNTAQLTLTNTLGQTLLQQSRTNDNGTQNMPIDLSAPSFPDGTYFLNVTTESGSALVFKLVKAK